MRRTRGHVVSMRGGARYAHGSQMDLATGERLWGSNFYVMCMRGYARYAHGPRPCEVHARLSSLGSLPTAT